MPLKQRKVPPDRALAAGRAVRGQEEKRDDTGNECRKFNPRCASLHKNPY